MADTKISALTAAAALTGAEIVPIVQSGSNVRSTVADIVAFHDWTLIATNSPSGAASSSFTAIPQTYAFLRMEISLSHNSGSAQVLLIELQDGTTWTTPIGITTTAVASGVTMSGGVFIPGYTGDAGVMMPNAEGVGASPATGTTAGGTVFFVIPWVVTGGIDGIRISASGGNITGTIKLLGL